MPVSRALMTASENVTHGNEKEGADLHHRSNLPVHFRLLL
jgi:hypothetical protein